MEKLVILTTCLSVTSGASLSQTYLPKDHDSQEEGHIDNTIDDQDHEINNGYLPIPSMPYETVNTMPDGQGNVLVRGAFEYQGDDGRVYSVTFTAREDGFRLPAAGVMPPLPMAIPQDILVPMKPNDQAAAGIFDDNVPYNPEAHVHSHEDTTVPYNQEAPVHSHEDTKIQYNPEAHVPSHEDIKVPYNQEATVHSSHEDTKIQYNPEAPVHSHEDTKIPYNQEAPVHSREDTKIPYNPEAPVHSHEDTKIQYNPEAPVRSHEDTKIQYNPEALANSREDTKVQYNPEAPVHSREDIKAGSNFVPSPQGAPFNQFGPPNSQFPAPQNSSQNPHPPPYELMSGYH